MAKHTGCDNNICQDQGRRGTKESKPSTIDIVAKKAAIQAEFTVELDGKEKAGRYYIMALISDIFLPQSDKQVFFFLVLPRIWTAKY
jgi:hypothetical protein